jgi:hypothetical protein
LIEARQTTYIVNTQVLPALKADADQIQTSVDSVQNDISAVRTHADRTMIAVGAVARNIDLATRSLQNQETQQAQYLGEMSKGVQGIVANTSDTLTKTSALLSHASVSIDNLNASLVELPATVRNAGKLLGDPNIPVIFSNLAGIAADGKKEADKLITPVTKAKAAFMFAWNSTLRFAGAFFGVK